MFLHWFRLLMLKWPYFKAPYTDPTTGLRYHDKSVFEVIKGLVSIFRHPIFPSFLRICLFRAQVWRRSTWRVCTSAKLSQDSSDHLFQHEVCILY